MLHYIRHCACLIAKTGMTVALGLMVMTASFADTLPAGNFVTNRAETRFFNPRLGITERIFSNTVEALVIEAPAIEVTGFSDLLLARGAQEQHYFSVQNTGNSPLNIMLDVQNHAEAGLLTAQEIYVDVNNNGLIDSQDQLVQPQITLAIDAKISLIYQFVVAPNAPVGATATSTLVVMANSVNTGAPLNDVPSALGHVTIVEQGLELSKSVQQRTMGTGQNLTFTLQLRNNGQVDVAGYDAVDGTSILIDGHPAIGVLVFDEIPLNTQFSAVQATGGLQPLYHLQGAPKHSYQTRAPDQNGQVDAVGFFWAGAYPVGQSSDLSFSVNLINDLGPMSVRNIAYTYAGGETFASNEVVFDRATGIAQISFIDGAGNETQFAALGADAAVQIFSGACNTTFQIDRFDVTITSQITGDSEVVRAHETAANSGVFITTNLPLVQMPNPVAFDGVLASDQGDTLSARADCDTIALVTTAMVNPGSFVFNSVTNAPVSDATIYVVDAAGMRHATVQSDHTGYFVVGDLPAGQYRYEVSTPSGFAFPSVRQSFPGYERATGSFSYGRMFSHDGGSLHHKDIPLDPAYGVPLTLEKTVDRQVVSTGQMATYTLTVLNQMDQALIAAEVIDVIPSGTQLVPGSVIMNGEKASDPVIAANNDHVFDLGDMMPLAQIELRYTLRFTPAATQGDAVNIAVVSGLQAGTGQVRVSNTARAVVRINNSGGVFTRQGTIIGSVFLDCNENGLRDGADELGVPGVQITTQEGLSVVTDLHGKYSFIAMRPVSHVLSLMERTLPANTSVRVSKTADLGRGGSRLVAVTRGGLHSEEFGLSACSADVIAAMNDRRAAFAGRALTSGQLRSDLPFNSGQADRRSSRSQAGLATTTQIQSNDPEQMLLQRTNTAAVERRTLESQVKMFDTTLAFLNLADGQQVSNAAISVDVKGPGDLTLNLQLNGRDVSATHIGETTLWAEGNVQARRFVAVDLRAGKNTLSLTGTDPFGIVRALQTVVITAPGAPHHIQVTAPATAIAAAGQPVPVTVTFMDAQGVPVNVSSGVTLRAKLGTWNVADIRGDQPGVQAFVNNGSTTFGLMAPQIIGNDTVTVTTSFGGAEVNVIYTPDLSERILVGVLEASTVEQGATNPFEDANAGLRGEVYLKTRIPGDALMTLRYSNQNTQTGLFRDLATDQGYPVYGDNSERGFDAQSSTDLYVRVEKGRGYGVYGDLAITPDASAFKLGGYSRLTTGVSAGWANADVTVSGFAAKTAQSQRSVEFAGRGVSGPYTVDLTDYRQGSERVEVIERDAFSGEIIAARPMRRLTDYVLNYFSNTIVFDTPVRQFNDDGNPVSVRVTFETLADGGPKYWIYGGEVNYQVAENTRVGTRLIAANASAESGEKERIVAAYLESELASNLTFNVEAAQSKTGLDIVGFGIRTELKYQTETTKFDITASHIDTGFTPSGSAFSAGQQNIGMGYQVQLDDVQSLAISAQVTKDLVTGNSRSQGELIYERAVNSDLTTRVGLRYQDTGDQEGVTQLVGMTWAPYGGDEFTFDANLDLPISGDGVGQFELAADAELRPGLVLSAGAKFQLDEEGRYDRNTNMRIGLQYNLTDTLGAETQLQTDGSNGRNARLYQSLDGNYRFSENLALNYGVEVSGNLDGETNALTSVSLGAKWQSEDDHWVANSDIDMTFEDEGETYFADLGVAGEINPALTMLGRARIAVDTRGDAGRDTRARARLGLAYRPIEDSRLNALAWYEYRHGSDGKNAVEHLWSLDASYEASETMTLRGKYAGHKISQDLEFTSDSSLTQLLQAGLNIDLFDDRAQFGLNLMHFWDDLGNQTNAAGIEFGVTPAKGTLLSIGYNASQGSMNHRNEVYQDGIYFRLRIALDNTLLDRLSRFGAE